MKKSSLVFLLLLVMFIFSANLVEAAWWDQSWIKRQEVNISNAGSSVLRDFTAYINVTYDSNMQADYEDLRFMNGSCSEGQSIQLAHEIENYTSGSALVWVRVLSIPASGVASICMYYGNSGASSGENATGAWINYSMVYHFNEPSGTTGANSILDSTGNTNGTPSAGISLGNVGKIGSTADFSSGTGISLGVVGSSVLTAETTISFWAYSNNVASPARQNPFNQAYGGWGTMTLETNGAISWFFGSNGGDSSPYGSHQSSASTVTGGSWIYITSVRNPSGYTYKWYKNGNYLTGSTYSATYPVITSRTFTIGDGYVYPFNGKLDEFRVSTVARSADWINQEYQLVMNQGSYVSFGAEEDADITPPLITLNKPDSGINTSSQSLTFNFTAVEDYTGDMNCSLYIDSNFIMDNASTMNNTLTNLNATGIVGGNHYWNISCNDLAGNQNWSETRSFYVDLSPPTASNVVYSPNATDDIDPGTNITINATVSDSRVSVSSVILQYYNGTDWSNITITNNSATNYNATITTVSSEQNYTFNIWANDSFGNSNHSVNQTFSSSWDCTWDATSDLGQVAGWDENKWIGDITINNTGDSAYSNSNCSLSFHLAHDLTTGRVYFDDWGLNSVYNYYDTLSISAKSNVTIKVNATFLSEVKEESVIITITESYSRSSTSSRNTTATTISTTGGPYLFETVTSNPSSLDLTFHNFSLEGYVRNLVGDDTLNNTAYNVSFNWSLPSNFLVKDGNATLTYANLSNSSLIYNYINVTFNATNLPNLSPGIANVYLYAQGVNSTGAVISHAGNVTLLTKQINISLSCYGVSDGITVSACGSLDGDYVAPSTETTGATGGGGGGGAVDTTKYEKSEASFELLIGEQQEFKLEIENKLEGYKENIRIKVSGIKPEYIKIIPEEITRINPKSSKNITVKITAPAYFTEGKYTLIFNIEGVIVLNATRTAFSERKTVVLYIVEIAREKASEMLNESREMLKEMSFSNMSLEDVILLLEQSEDYYDKIDFLAVKKNYEKIKEIYDSAFESLKIINDLKEKIADAENRGIKIIETKKILYIAEATFNRGDYLLALKKLNDAKMTYALETKGEFNILYTVKNHPYQTLLSLLGISVFSFASSLVVRLRLYKRKLRMLEEEEKLLLQLMKVVQKECFENNKMSMEEYGEAMSQYEHKLSKTIEDKICVETRISNLLKLKGRKKALFDEKERLIELVKDIQDKYLNRGEIETRIYENMLKSYSTKISEVEGQLTFLEAKEALKSHKFFRRFFRKRKERKITKEEVKNKKKVDNILNGGGLK